MNTWLCLTFCHRRSLMVAMVMGNAPRKPFSPLRAHPRPPTTWQTAASPLFANWVLSLGWYFERSLCSAVIKMSETAGVWIGKQGQALLNPKLWVDVFCTTQLLNPRGEDEMWEWGKYIQNDWRCKKKKCECWQVRLRQSKGKKWGVWWMWCEFSPRAKEELGAKYECPSKSPSEAATLMWPPPQKTSFLSGSLGLEKNPSKCLFLLELYC